jgi:hypothetical protein
MLNNLEIQTLETIKALSSAETKYVALASCTRNVKCMQELLDELNVYHGNFIANNNKQPAMHTTAGVTEAKLLNILAGYFIF